MLLRKEDSILIAVDVQEKLTPHVLQKEAFTKRCEWLVELALTMNVPFMITEQYPKGLGSTIEPLKKQVAKKDCIEKLFFSCMQEPHFVHRFSEHKKNQIILIGIEAHVCVLQTALEMKTAGFDVFVVVDAISSRQEIDLNYALQRMRTEGIHLITAEMVFFEWLRQSGVAQFKSLSQKFLQS